MDWKDVAGAVGRFAPLVGTALGGPAGAAVGALVSAALGTANTPDAVSQALQIDPAAAMKLAEIEKDRTLGIQQLAMQSEANRIAADTAAIQAVNATMQAEDKAEHWASWLWRPFLGFIAGVMIFGCYFVLPLSHIPAPLIPSEVWYFLGAVLGVASFFRGKAQADPTNTAPVHG